MNGEVNKKYKRPKKKTLATTDPETTTSRNSSSERGPANNVCPLLAKDSEWVDILHANGLAESSQERGAAEEEVLQLVECEDGPRMKPLAIMFPGLLDKDPQTLRGMLSRAMSTTEVTRQLVDLGQKANFEFMKKADRLIPPEKQWLDSVTESSNSVGSMGSTANAGCHTSSSNSYEASPETSIKETSSTMKKKKLGSLSKCNPSPTLPDYDDYTEKKGINQDQEK